MLRPRPGPCSRVGRVRPSLGRVGRPCRAVTGPLNAERDAGHHERIRIAHRTAVAYGARCGPGRTIESSLAPHGTAHSDAASSASASACHGKHGSIPAMSDRQWL
jgi:hypothetical protein